MFSLLAWLHQEDFMKGVAHVDSWLTRPMWDRQVRPQRSQSKVTSGTVVIFPPAEFLPLDVLLEGGDGLVDDVAPGEAISSQSRPVVMVSVAGREGLLQGVLLTLPWRPLSRWPEDSWPSRAIVGRRWWSILETSLWLQQHGLHTGDPQIWLFNDLNNQLFRWPSI